MANAPTVDDILESTIRAALQFTGADCGHAYLVRRDGDNFRVTYQCLVHPDGSVVRQKERDRSALVGPCHRALKEVRTIYVHDARANLLHQELLRDLATRAEAATDPIRREYILQYRRFLEPARSYISTMQESKKRQAQVAALEAEHQRLEARKRELARPDTVEAEARRLGMVRPGERPFVVRNLPGGE